MLISGLISLGLAGLVLWKFPASALVLPGVVVGVDLMFAGATLIAIRDAVWAVEAHATAA